MSLFSARPQRLSANPVHILRSLFRGVRRRKSRLSLDARQNALVEALETRTMLAGTGSLAELDAAALEHVHADGVVGSPRESDESRAGLLDGTAEGPFPNSETFKLHSKPDSTYKIYLDFDGQVVTGTPWNTNTNMPTIVNQPYDTDGDPNSFSNAEQDIIQRVWLMVAEDFAPFDVDVTTEDPGVEALRKVGSNDNEYGIRAIMTRDDFLNCGCGGVAFIGSFDWNTDTPAYIFNRGAFAMAETFSHEVGHALNLSHDGLNTGNVTYYPGHGTGVNGWGSIMGAPFSKAVTHWDNGQYFDSNNNSANSNFNRGPDDLQVITTSEGFGYRRDDYGNTIGTASDFNFTSLSQIDTGGYIERNTDLDVFRFETGNGPVSFNLTNFSDRPNLDIWAGIYDSTGNLVAESNPSGDLSASFSSVQLTTGVYYLKVDGVGSHGVYNPLTDTVEDPANPPWQNANPVGYSQYGSLGQYRITGNIVATQLDYGDAPDTYGTTEATDGARHLSTGVMLGTFRDFEDDGRPTADARGDDQFGLDDEDGVTFLTPFIPGLDARISVNSSADGFLDAWLDENGNGTFEPEEQIYTDLAVVAGDQELTIPISDTVASGTAYLRFRVADTADQVTGPTGKADSGEVEDYAVDVEPIQLINEVLWNPVGETDTGNEYIELRGEAGSTIPDGTYLVAVDGDSASGNVEFVYDVSGLEYGTNGYLTLLQNGNPYQTSVDPESTVVVSTGAGWIDGNRRVRFLSRVATDIENGSVSFMLVRTESPPRPGNDIDSDGDGTADGSVYGRWTVIDSVGVIDSDNDSSYAALVYSTSGTGLTPPNAVIVNTSGSEPEYVGRIGESVKSTTADWIGARLQSGGAAPILATTYATGLENRPLDHIGAVNFVQFDFGDLPDSYGTLAASNGPSHAPGGPYFGSSKDLESDAAPGPLANGDDAANDDDEDGVVIPALKEGTAGTISVSVANVVGSAVVQAWFDWNGDGVFSADEKAISQTVTQSRAVEISVTAPLGAFDETLGATYARFRVSSAGDLEATGAAADGEVEDYAITILTSATSDFGDAPDTYGTTLAADGARHLEGGPGLGILRDIERDGFPTPNAIGDNLNKFADEDGITFPTAITPGRRSTVGVFATDGGYLDAWLDADQNGTFDAGEHVIENVAVLSGMNWIEFDTPASAELGETFMRYRIASTAAGVTGPTGEALDGEVEDYRVEVLPIFNRPPVVEDQVMSVTEGVPAGTSVGTVQATDPDLNQSLRYTILRGNLNQAFAINPATGEITVNEPDAVDFEFVPEFSLTVLVTDSGDPPLSRTSNVTITVEDVPGDPPSLAVREGTSKGILVGNVPLQMILLDDADSFQILSGNTGNAFSVDALGAIRVNNPNAIDFEQIRRFELEILVTDVDVPVTETVMVTIKVIDRNERPNIDDQFFEINDGARAGAVVGTVVATDPDIGSQFTFTIFSGNDDGAFLIDRFTGQIRVADSSTLNLDEDPVVKLGVLVEDTGDPSFSDHAVMTIQLRKTLFFDNFEDGSVDPPWTASSAVGVRPSGQGNQAVFMAGTLNAPQVHELTLDFNVAGYDSIKLILNRTVLSAATTGRVEVNTGGPNWITLNTFSGTDGNIVLGQSKLVHLDVSRAAIQNLMPITLQGDLQIRFTTQTNGVGDGISMDNIILEGKNLDLGPSDVFIFDANSNRWILGDNNGTQFVQTPTSAWPAGTGWKFVQGDFNGDGRTDVGGLNDAGEWWVGTSAGTSLNINRWATWQAANWQDLLVGDFNGDGRDDVAVRNATTGAWQIAQSNTIAFDRVDGGRWAANGWISFHVGDFNDDGLEDISGYLQQGYWYVGFAQAGGGFKQQFVGRWSATNAQTHWSDVLVGDYNGDGRSDVAGRRENGDWWLGLSNGNTFAFVFATRWNASTQWDEVLVGDFNGDGLSDILGREANGQWWLNRSVGTSMVVSYMGSWNSIIPWTTVVGDYNNDGIDDVAGFDASRGLWLVGIAGGSRLQGQFFNTDWFGYDDDFIGAGLFA